jgi:hypothetical protein
MKITALSPLAQQDACEAWRLSRDVNAHPSFDDIAGVDAPVNEMSSALLHFQDFMIIEREIFASLRSHVMWARTSRVDDPLQFSAPAEYMSAKDIFRVRLKMQDMRAEGLHQDIWRGQLPLVAYTSWVARISFRELVKLGMYFEYLAAVLPGPLAARCSEIAVLLHRQLPTGDYDTSTYKMEHYLCEDFIYDEPKVVKTDHFTILRMQVPLMLRAQLVRHRPISFTDDFWFLLTDHAIAQYNLTALVTMECCAPQSFWQSIVTKRSCWIAQWDIWAPVIKALDATGTSLPCSHEAPCPYVADNVLRADGKDPSPPCPIYCNRSGTLKDHSVMMAYAEGRQDFWQKEINQ